MRRVLIACTGLVLAAQLVPGLTRAAYLVQEDRVEYPLAPSRIAVHRTTMVFRASWAGPRGRTSDPRGVGSSISMSGVGDGGVVSLARERWSLLPKGRGYRYRGSADGPGGIRSILVRMKHKGGTVTITRSGVQLPGSGMPDTMAVSLGIGTARWCAGFQRPFKASVRGMIARSNTAPPSCPCADGGKSTWPAIQTAIIERYGCTEAACHGGVPLAGGLDLRPDVAFRNLVNVPSQLNPSLLRVKRGDRSDSVLWLKLATKTQGSDYTDASVGTGMPSGTAPAVSKDELEAVRIWIQAGAPETGVVAGTEELLSTCLGPPDPIKITPPAPPATDDGIQLSAPPWTIVPRNAQGQNGEGEICQSTHYDVSDQIPPGALVPRDDPRCLYWTGRCTNDASKRCGADGDCTAPGTCKGDRDCFYFKRNELTQDPNSHHSIIHIYRGRYDVGSPEYEKGFGPFTCRAGDNAGHACDPTGPATQCPGSMCAGPARSSIACVLYGPQDYGYDITGTGSNNAPSIGGSQQPYSDQRYPTGVYGIYPVSGTVIWNSHAFNVTDRSTTNEQWFNVYFAKTPEEQIDRIRPIFDSRHIFVQNVPPFQKVEYCSTTTMDQGAVVAGLSSHTHKRGVLFRIWEPPNTPCVPCSGNAANCTVPNPDCAADSRPSLASTTTYNDPIQYGFNPPRVLNDPDPAARTFKFCSLYDNGLHDPSEVKRRSTSPNTPFGRLGPGGPCLDTTVACMNGPHKGVACGGHDTSCDSTPGAGDGVCDACPLLGGVTTEDEMFIMLGTWYWPGHP
jgi:hypothetical protein